MFFGALFPRFIDPEASTIVQLVILGGTHLAVDGAILVARGWIAVRAAARIRAQSYGAINRICGTPMLGAAAVLAGRSME